MPTTVRAAFQELLKRIELNPSRVEVASQRYNAVKRTLENVLPTARIRQVGSFQRRTKIRPIDLGDGLDIDVLVELTSVRAFAQPGQEGISTHQALSLLRSALTSNQTYKVMGPATDAPVIVLEYSDKDGFEIEVIPALADRTDAMKRLRSFSNTRPDSFLVPGPDGNWHRADYLYDANYITAVNCNQLIRGRLVPFIKIAKAFLRGQGVPLKSFHVEVLAARLMPEIARACSTQGIELECPQLLAAFLQTSSKYMDGPISLPQSDSEPIDSGLSVNELLAVSEWMQKLATIAWDICASGDGAQAIDLWKEFFGSPFPTG